MRPEEIEIFERARPELSRSLIPSEVPLLESLRDSGVLSEDNVQHILKICQTQPEKNATRELLHIVARKSASLEPLIEAVTKCCYQTCIKALTAPASSDNQAPPMSPTTAKRTVSNVLMTGGVPRQPDIYVERPVLLGELRRALFDLASSEETGGWVVVHGMGGIGKSVLAAAVLDDITIISNGFTKIFWVNIGPHGEERLLSILNDLFARVDLSERQIQFGSEEQAQKKLNDVFTHDYARALIVLDDVWTKKVIEIFSELGCRLMVTLRDTSIMDAVYGTKFVVPVPESGFTSAEAMESFAKWTRIDRAMLPNESVEIYRKCGGHPFEISLIGSFLRENPSRWNYYLELLKTRQVDKISKSTPYKFDNFEAAVRMSLDNLPSDLGERFRSLGVFQRGGEIPAKALMVYWQQSIEEVEDTMAIFVKRSLIERRARSPMETYRIQVLLHEIIKKMNASASMQKGLHLQLLQYYLQKSNGRWDRLPRDGYIHEFLAYHFFRSNNPETPWNVFLNLPFMANVLLQCGPAQTLTNLQHYADMIRAKDETGFKDFEGFILKNMHLLTAIRKGASRDDFDEVLRLALNESPNSNVHRQAYELNQKLHFAVAKHIENGSYSNGNKSTIGEVKQVGLSQCAIRQALWMNNGGERIYAAICVDGTLRIASHMTGQTYHKIKMEYAAECVTISPDCRHALVSSDHGLFTFDLPDATVWVRTEAFKAEPVDAEAKKALATLAFSDRTPSPLLHTDWPQEPSTQSQQRGYELPGSISDDDKAAGDGPTNSNRRYRWCEISNDGRTVIAGDTNGSVLMWNFHSDPSTNGESLGAHAGAVNCCKFNINGDMVASVGDDGIASVWKLSSKKKLRDFDGHEKRRISACAWINGGRLANCVLTNSYAEFAVWSPQDGSLKRKWSASTKAVCMDVSKDGQFVATGLIDGSIMIWNLTHESNNLFAKYPGVDSDPALPTSVQFDAEGKQLLISRQNGWIEIWNIEMNRYENEN